MLLVLSGSCNLLSTIVELTHTCSSPALIPCIYRVLIFVLNISSSRKLCNTELVISEGLILPHLHFHSWQHRNNSQRFRSDALPQGSAITTLNLYFNTHHIMKPWLSHSLILTVLLLETFSSWWTYVDIQCCVVFHWKMFDLVPLLSYRKAHRKQIDLLRH